MEFKDYYQTMGVARDATADDIKRAYRKLARRYHPDVSKEADAEARFKDVAEAYEVLKDPEKRAAYDQLGANWKAGQEFRPPPGSDTGFEFSGGGPDASEFFEALFGRGAFRAQSENRHARVLIDLEDAYRGATRAITLRTPEVDASGQVSLREHTLNVTIPRGVRPGQHIRLAGQGGPAIDGGKRGDLYLEVGFRPHPLYRVEERDVFLDLPVAPWEAALGATVTVPTPAGAVELKVPPGTAAGRKLRLKGRGIPATPPGDLYAVLKIALPPADTAAGQAVYANMSEQFRSFNPPRESGSVTMQNESTPASVVAILIEEHTELTLDDISGACAVESRAIVALVDEGVLEPVGSEAPHWRFSGAQLRRATAALRLQRDLGVNAAGVALALDLLEEIDRLRAELRGSDLK